MTTLILAILATFSPAASSSSTAQSVTTCAGYTIAHLDSGRTVIMCGGHVVQVSDEMGNVRTFEVK